MIRTATEDDLRVIIIEMIAAIPSGEGITMSDLRGWAQRAGVEGPS